jgi:hypothetical protein
MMMVHRITNSHVSTDCETRIINPASAAIKIMAMLLATCDPVENGKSYNEACQKPNEPKKSAWVKYWFSHLNLLPLHSTTTIGYRQWPILHHNS